MNERDQFITGYVCAIADLLRLHDQPTMAKELLNNLGGASVAKAHGYDVDVKVLRKAGLFKGRP